jgi:hypothetical protein
VQVTGSGTRVRGEREGPSVAEKWYKSLIRDEDGPGLVRLPGWRPTAADVRAMSSGYGAVGRRP